MLQFYTIIVDVVVVVDVDVNVVLVVQFQSQQAVVVVVYCRGRKAAHNSYVSHGHFLGLILIASLVQIDLSQIDRDYVWNKRRNQNYDWLYIKPKKINKQRHNNAYSVILCNFSKSKNFVISIFILPFLFYFKWNFEISYLFIRQLNEFQVHVRSQL